jgi:hypothetical protein
MKNRRGRIQFFLVMAISFWLGMYPIYVQYDNLSEIDFFSPIPSFEILDPEDLLAHEENKEKILALCLSFGLSSLPFCPGSPFLFPFFQTFFFDQLPSILRC